MMNPNDIKLESIDRMFHYETQARYLDELDREPAIEMAKCYLKLYLKQQEVLADLGAMGLTDED